MAGQESLILNDGHSTSIWSVDVRTGERSGDGGELHPQLSYGYYSPTSHPCWILPSCWIRSIRAVSIHPALASAHGNEVALTLNTAPSFHNPNRCWCGHAGHRTSPAAAAARRRSEGDLLCSEDALVLPVEGARWSFDFLCA